MKYIFTFALNCVLLILVTEAYEHHYPCPAESLRGLIKTKTVLLNELCTINAKIHKLRCENLVIKFSEKLTHLYALIDQVIHNFLDDLDTYDGNLILEADKLVFNTGKYEKILEQAEELASKVDIALNKQPHPHHHKPCGHSHTCSCSKLSQLPSKCIKGCERKKHHQPHY